MKTYINQVLGLILGEILGGGLVLSFDSQSKVNLSSN
jgi:hypothetical protein